MPLPRTTKAPTSALLILCACSGSGTPATPITPTSVANTIASTVVGGATDALAAELLLAGRDVAGLSWHAEQAAVDDAVLARDLDAMALDHLRSSTFDSGTGPDLTGSARVRRLAAAPGAPPDGNGNGSNLDEVLSAETTRILAFAQGLPSPALLAQPVLPWRTRSAELAAPLALAGPPAAWHTRDLGDRDVRMVDAAAFLLLRALAGRRLTTTRSHGVFGADPEAGSLGLLALQQLLAAEETLFLGGFTGGGPLGSIGDPSAYDPTAQPRWLPATVTVDLDPALPGAFGNFRSRDSASDLVALSTVMRASAEIANLADPADPLAVPELFRGHPFQPPPNAPIPTSINWTNNVFGVLAHHCGFCHIQQQRGNFSLASYNSMLAGGTKVALTNRPVIVPGNAQASVLYQVLTNPVPPFNMMPQLGGPVPAEDIALIEEWINTGALEDPPTPPAPPRPGEDMAMVSFFNLVALHLDPVTGAPSHRVEADGPSGVATALATGHALRALAAVDRAIPGLEWNGETAAAVLQRVVAFTAASLLDSTGRAVDAFETATGASTAAADLRGQAALTAGLLAAASRLLPGSQAETSGRAAAAALLAAYTDGNGRFGPEPGFTAVNIDAATLADLLAALRLAATQGVAGADARRTLLLRQLRPALAFAEWGRNGEVVGDGIADTDGDGLPEPAAAGGDFGRLPLLVDRIRLGPDAPLPSRPITWSQHVRPLLLNKCGECHLNGSQQGQYRLDTRRALTIAGESQGQFALLIPGDADGSFLFQKMSSRQPALGSQMPLQRTPLSATAIDVVRRWIESGASAR